MAEAYAWHPGKASVEPSWTVPVGLLPDETISSWLIRAALTHGCSPGELTGWISPGWRAWMADVDRGVAEDRLPALAGHAGIEADAFRRAALVPIAARIEGRTPDPKKAWMWILTRGPVTARQERTAQYCPECLAQDRTPYYRLSWRLAWHTMCAVHGATLVDRCPVCASAVLPHRLDERAPHAASCAACEADLREGRGSVLSPDALSFQGMADHAVQSREAPCHGERIVAREWFLAAGFFATLVRRAARQSTRTISAFLAELDVEPPSAVRPVPGAGLERLGCRDRQQILEGVCRIMSADAERLEDAVARSGISRQGLCEKGQRIPGAIARILPKLPENGHARRTHRPRQSGPRQRNEVLRMMQRLERALKSEER